MLQFDKLSKQVRTCYILLGASVASAILHNIYFSIFRSEEALFFLLFFALFIGFLYCIAKYTFAYQETNDPGDIWKLGFIGFIGLVGFIANLKYIFFIFFLFFLYFIPKLKSYVKDRKM